MASTASTAGSLSLDKVLQKCAQFSRLEMDTKLESFNGLVDACVSGKNMAALFAILRYLMKKEARDVAGKIHTIPNVLDHFIKRCSEAPDEDTEDGDAESKFFSVDDQTKLANAVHSALEPVRDDYIVQVMHATRWLSECFQAEGDFRHAAVLLSQFDFKDRRVASAIDAAYQMKWWIDATMFFLEIGDSGSAGRCIQNGHQLISSSTVKSEPTLVASFKSCYARVLDSERKFLLAAKQYLGLSQMFGVIDEGDLVETLGYAMTCCILAKAGPSRTRVLGRLFNDERASQLPNFSMLEKMYKECIIRAGEVRKFEELLQVHQNAQLAGGETVLSRSVKQHNVLACMRIYNNIRFDELGDLLGTSAGKAESIVSKMIEEGRLEAAVDQVEGVVEFGDAQNQLIAWDKHIQNVCMDVNDTLESIASKYPEYSF